MIYFLSFQGYGRISFCFCHVYHFIRVQQQQQQGYHDEQARKNLFSNNNNKDLLHRQHHHHLYQSIYTCTALSLYIIHIYHDKGYPVLDTTGTRFRISDVDNGCYPFRDSLEILHSCLDCCKHIAKGWWFFRTHNWPVQNCFADLGCIWSCVPCLDLSKVNVDLRSAKIMVNDDDVKLLYVLPLCKDPESLKG